MRYILLALCLCSCDKRGSSDELADMAHEVIKSQQGIEIRMTPVQEEKGISVVNKKF